MQNNTATRIASGIKRVEIDCNGVWREFDLTEQEFQLFGSLMKQSPARGDGEAAERALIWGEVENNSPYKLGVYGPKSPQDISTFDNTLYVMGGYLLTPENWDCDGAFIPNDVSVTVNGATYRGPLAVKIPDYDKLYVSGTYHERVANGTFATVLRDGEVNWLIPNASQADVDATPIG